MVKRLLILVLLLPVTVAVLAQNRTITGTLYDGEMKEHVPFAVVQLLKQDSSYVVGATSDETGTFKVTALANGRYILKASYVGYRTIFQNVTIANEQDVSVGQLDFQTDTHTEGGQGGGERTEGGREGRHLPIQRLGLPHAGGLDHRGTGEEAARGGGVGRRDNQDQRQGSEEDSRQRKRIHGGRHEDRHEEPPHFHHTDHKGLRPAERPHPCDGHRRRQRVYGLGLRCEAGDEQGTFLQYRPRHRDEAPLFRTRHGGLLQRQVPDDGIRLGEQRQRHGLRRRTARRLRRCTAGTECDEDGRLEHELRQRTVAAVGWQCSVESCRRRPGRTHRSGELRGAAGLFLQPPLTAVHPDQLVGRPVPSGVAARFGLEHHVPPEHTGQQERRTDCQHVGCLRCRSLRDRRRSLVGSGHRTAQSQGTDGEQPAEYDHHLRRQHFAGGDAAGEPPAGEKGTERDAAHGRRLYGCRLQDFLDTGPPVFPAAGRTRQRFHLPGVPVQPHADEELGLCRAGDLQRADSPEDLPAVQLSVQVRFLEEQPRHLRFLGTARSDIQRCASGLPRVEQLSRSAGTAGGQLPGRQSEPLFGIPHLHTRRAGDAAHDPQQVEDERGRDAAAPAFHLQAGLSRCTRRHGTDGGELEPDVRLPLPFQRAEQPAHQLQGDGDTADDEPAAQYHRQYRPAEHCRRQPRAGTGLHPPFPTLLQHFPAEPCTGADDLCQFLRHTQCHRQQRQL